MHEQTTSVADQVQEPAPPDLGTALAITAAELAGLMVNPERPAIVDTRIRDRYQQAHIPGAINIPAASLLRKPAPALGRVVVYGDGVDEAATRTAM